MTAIRNVFFFFLLISVFSCTGDSMYSTWTCAFAYDNGKHLDATLNTALQVNSPGIFCSVWEDVRGGKKKIFFRNNHGDASEQWETAEEQKADFVLGLNNGIVFGYANNMTDDFGNYVFVAYDLQCPNCVASTNNTFNPNFRISISSAGIGTCPKCTRRYDLNSSGQLIDALSEDDKRHLERYRRAFTAGPNSYVSVFR